MYRTKLKENITQDDRPCTLTLSVVAIEQDSSRFFGPARDSKYIFILFTLM